MSVTAGAMEARLAALEGIARFPWTPELAAARQAADKASGAWEKAIREILAAAGSWDADHALMLLAEMLEPAT